MNREGAQSHREEATFKVTQGDHLVIKCLFSAVSVHDVTFDPLSHEVCPNASEVLRDKLCVSL